MSSPAKCSWHSLARERNRRRQPARRPRHEPPPEARGERRAPPHPDRPRHRLRLEMKLPAPDRLATPAERLVRVALRDHLRGALSRSRSTTRNAPSRRPSTTTLQGTAADGGYQRLQEPNEDPDHEQHVIDDLGTASQFIALLDPEGRLTYRSSQSFTEQLPDQTGVALRGKLNDSASSRPSTPANRSCGPIRFPLSERRPLPATSWSPAPSRRWMTPSRASQCSSSSPASSG